MENQATAQFSQAQAAFTELRKWVAQHCAAGHPVRHQHYHMALTAIVHRLVKFGPDETLNELDCRDLLNLLFFLNGQNAEWVMRTAFTRAIIDDDKEVVDMFLNTKFIPECREWYNKLCAGIIGVSDDPEQLTTWVDTLQPEEKSVARLLVCRVFPDTATYCWLDDVPAEQPRLAFKLAEVISRKRLYQNAVSIWMHQHPFVRNESLV